jgi:hypothetical protein
MAENIPLNFYKRITTSLSRAGSIIYTTPSDRASIVLNTFTNNNTNDNRYVTVALSSTSQDSLALLNRFPLGQRDIVNITPEKLILSEGDSIFATGDIQDITNLNDPAMFWEFNLPTEIISLDDLTFGFTTGTGVTADFGSGNLTTQERVFNSNFDDWSGWTTQTFAVSGGVLGTGPTGWRQGLNISPASGTFQLLRINSTTEDSQYFNNQYYSRVLLNNVSFSGDYINDPKMGARGILVATGSGGVYTISLVPVLSSVATGETIFGKTVKIKTWLKASTDAKVVIDGPAWFTGFSSVDPKRPTNGVNNNFTIVNVTTAWKSFETTFLIPTLTQWRQGAYYINSLDINDPNWGTPSYVYPLLDPNDVIPLSAYSFQIRFNFFRGPQTLLYDGYKNNWTVAASANSSLITNGYYDIGGLDVFIGDSSGFVPLSSFVPVDHTYDLSNETDTNVTLSILETDNRVV